MAGLDGLLASLELNEEGAGRFSGTHFDEGHAVVFGGQLLAQSLLAAARTFPGRQVLSMQTVFARGGNFAESLAIEVATVAESRAFASATVDTVQSHGVCTRSTVLLHAPDDDVVRHAAAPSEGAGRPDDWTTRTAPGSHWEIRTAGDVDVSDPDSVGPPLLPAWVRFPGAPDDPAIGQALLAYASDGFLIGTAMRPHAGVGQSMAHVSISTTVLTQTLSFHEPVRADRWLLLDHRSTYAGRGRCYGNASVFDEDGTMVASFCQDALLRRPKSVKPA